MLGDDGIETLGDVLRVRSREHPERIVLQEWDGARLAGTTCAALMRQVNAFSAALGERGVGARDAVAILMPNGRPWIVAYWGIHNLGGMAVPLEYEFLKSQPDRLSYVLGHCGARVAVVAPHDVERARSVAAPSGCEVLAFDDDALAHLPSEPHERPDVRPDEVAQVLYTSGTTGRNKGVALSHGGVLANVRACCKSFGVSESDCLPALLPHHHAYPLTTTVVLPLYAGARMPVGDVRDRRLGELLRAARPTVLVGVPRVLAALLDGVDRAASKADELDRLRRAEAVCDRAKRWTGLNAGRVLFRGLHKRLFGGMQLRFCVSGGARLSREVALRFLRLGIPVLQGWGMTELSPVGAVQPFSRARFLFTRYYEREAGSIGLPIEGTEIDLLDVPEQDIRVERDGKGEMVVRGPQVMVGYYRDPDTTARIMCEGGLRTGDIAARDERGCLHIVGRAKHVVVLPGGKKVFPEEDLEEELARCPCIEEFAVRAITGADGEEQIGVIIKPDASVLFARGVRTLGALHALLKEEITEALRGKPDYVRRLDFCVTELRDGRFCDLVKNSMQEPAPLKNEFRFDTAYSTARGSERALDLRTD